MPCDKPRTFAEIVAALDPEERARLERGERFDDLTVTDAFQRQLTVFEDRCGNGEWRVEYFDDFDTVIRRR